MIELQASVNKTVLTISDVPKIASGSKNYVSVRFQFDSEWSSIQPVMVCYRDIKAPFYNEISGGTAKIPHEVLRDPGPFYIGVFGVSGDIRVTSTVCRIIIQQGAISQNAVPSDPLNDIWSQIMIQYQEIKDLCKNIIATSEEAVKKAQGFADNASYSATVASQQQQMASKYASTASEAATKCEEGAQKALTAAVTAQDSKDAAQSASATAKSSATSAKAYADRAEMATTGIETALSQANAAAQNAQDAKSSAQAASQTAIKAAADASAAAVRAEKSATEVEQSAQQIAGAIDRLVIHDTAAGNPAVIRDGADWQMEELRVCGQSEQAGVPSPESPQEIVSKTVDGIVVTGANLINQPTLSFTHFTKIDLTNPLRPDTYTFSGVATTAAESDALLISCLDDSGKLVVSVYLPLGGRKHHTVTAARQVTALQIYAARNNAQAIGKAAKIEEMQIEIGSVVTKYEPYHAQTVKLSAPVTLRGVPVPSGGNVTINGQQYASDIITEREGAVGVERHTAMIDQYAGDPVDEPYISTTGELTTGASVVHTIPAEFSPLPDTDQQAIRSLRTYHGNTVVTTGAHTEVDYIADPKLYIDGKVTNLVTAYMQSIPVTIPLLNEEVVDNEG